MVEKMHLDSQKVELGWKKITWAKSRLKLLERIGNEFEQIRPFKNLTIGICLHIEPKTAVLCSVLQSGGADIAITGSPGTTQDEIAQALASRNIHVYGRQSDDRSMHIENINNVLCHFPNLVLDNGADLISINSQKNMNETLIGATEETTSGANRLREELVGQFSFPVIVINDSPLKLVVENEHGVGQTVVESFMRTTNLIVPSKRFVVLGYGSCGRGIAKYLKKFGGRVTVVEPDPIRGLEAAMDGMRVAVLKNVLDWGEVFITVTGRPGIIKREHFERMNNGVVLANAGHFSWEIDIDGLQKSSVAIEQLGDSIEQFSLKNGKKIILLSQGEMINLASGKGNPIETMDLGLALQALSLYYIALNFKELEVGPQPVPDEINKRVAKMMLESMFPDELNG